MQSDTNPLPAQTLMSLCDELAEAVRIERDLPEYAPADEAEAASDRVAVTLGKWLAARAASPVTLEEHLLAEERRTEIESIKACDVDDNPDLVAIVTAADDARNARKQHARRLAGEGGAA